MLRPVRKMKREGEKNEDDETIFWNKARGKGRGEIANGKWGHQGDGDSTKRGGSIQKDATASFLDNVDIISLEVERIAIYVLCSLSEVSLRVAAHCSTTAQPFAETE